MRCSMPTVETSEYGHRFLTVEARDAGWPMARRTAWRICSGNGWFSAFSKKQRGKNTRPGTARA